MKRRGKDRTQGNGGSVSTKRAGGVSKGRDLCFPPKDSLQPEATGWGWQSGKAFQMQAFARKPFCFVNCFQAGRGLQASSSVPKYPLSCRVYCPGAALLSLGEEPPEAVSCCLVLLNNDQIFSSFFYFLFFSSEITSFVTFSLSTPHTMCCSLCL